MGFAKTFKTIDGLPWHFHGYFFYKSDAKSSAEKLRKQGMLVRTYRIQISKGEKKQYVLYTLEKKYSKGKKK